MEFYFQKLIDLTNAIGVMWYILHVLVILAGDESTIPEPEAPLPEFVSQLQAVKANKNEQATFMCQLKTTSPDISIKWLKGNQEILNDDHFQIVSETDGTQKLIIANTKMSDAEAYHCIAESKAGQAQTQARLDIRGTYI